MGSAYFRRAFEDQHFKIYCYQCLVRLWRDVHDALLFAVLAVDAAGFDVHVAHKTGSSVQREQECGLDVTLARATGSAVQVLSRYTGIKSVTRRLEPCMWRMPDYNESKTVCVLSLFIR